MFANITIDRDQGKATGYYSVRRPVIHRSALEKVEALYARLREIEQRDGVDAALAWLEDHLAGRKTSYRDFVLSLYHEG